MSPEPETTNLSFERHTIGKFDGKNFSLWKFKMQMVLEERDQWNIVTGHEKRSTTDERAKNSYDSRARKAMATVCLSLSDSQLMLVKNESTVRDVWAKLEKQHERKGLANKLFLRRKLFNTFL